MVQQFSINNQRGSISVFQLIFAAIGLAAAVSVMGQVNSAQGLIKNEIAKDRAENAKKYINYALKDRSVCATQLKTLYSRNHRSSNNTSATQDTVGGSQNSTEATFDNESQASSGSPSTNHLRDLLVTDIDNEDNNFSISNEAGIAITDVQISYEGNEAKKWINGNNAHLGQLIISVTIPGVDHPTGVKLPIYLLYGSNNQLRECFTTSVKANGATPEDEICQTLNGERSFYDPSRFGCHIPQVQTAEVAQ